MTLEEMMLLLLQESELALKTMEIMEIMEINYLLPVSILA